MPDGYEKVCMIISEEMDKAWTGILQKLATKDVESLRRPESTVAITDPDLTDFVEKLSAARLSVDFMNRVGKAHSGALFNAHSVQPLAPERGEVRVGIQIGIEARW